MKRIQNFKTIYKEYIRATVQEVKQLYVPDYTVRNWK